MFQETHPIEKQFINTEIKTKTSFNQSLVRIFQVIWAIICMIVVLTGAGFHALANNGVPQSPRNNEFWWESREQVNDLFKK